MEVVKKNYDNLDLLKFILSIFIVAIHCQLLPRILYPWLRLAIPLFFIVSSYLLHIKLNNSDKKNEKDIIIKYVFRQLKLYLFWFIVLIPVTIFIRDEWFGQGLVVGTLKFIRSLLFSSTFMASWFISSTIFGTIIIWYITKRHSNIFALSFSFVAYVVCCLISSYSFLFNNINFIKDIYKYYCLIFTSPVFSFPVSFVWITIGKMFADKNNKKKTMNHRIIYVLLCFSLIFLYIEWIIVYKFTGSYNNDCYFMLFPCACLIYFLVLSKEINIAKAKTLRKISTITYPLHASLAVIIRYVLINTNRYSDTVIGVIAFAVVLIACYTICFIIFKLEKCKCFKWLKYSH